MALQESGEMYLESILILSESHEHVRSIDISEFMNFSKPSVSRAVGLLKAGGYITVDPNGYIDLTDEGHKIADSMYERHKLLSNLFINLGVSPETAVEDACKIEHDISEETFEALRAHAKHFSKDKDKM